MSETEHHRMMALLEVTELEEKVVEPYLKMATTASLEEKSQRVKEQTQVLLQTNTALAEKLTEQDLICRELEDRHHEFTLILDDTEHEQGELKRLERDVRDNLKVIGQGRRSEELRLRRSLLHLEEKLSNLTAENMRLWNQEREEHMTIERLSRQIEHMEGEAISLEEKKAWLDRAEEMGMQGHMDPSGSGLFDLEEDEALEDVDIDDASELIGMEKLKGAGGEDDGSATPRSPVGSDDGIRPGNRSPRSPGSRSPRMRGTTFGGSAFGVAPTRKTSTA